MMLVALPRSLRGRGLAVGAALSSPPVRVEVVHKPLTEIDADLHVVARTTAEKPVPAQFAAVP